MKDGTYMKRFQQAMQLFYKKHFRKSAMFDVFMSVGTLFFMMAKKNKRGPVKKPVHYMLFSQDEALKVAVEQKLNHNVEHFTRFADTILASRPHTESAHTEVILDNELLTFGQIIAIMERYKEKEYTYKIRPAGTNYMLGSNSSNDRGEVLVLEKLATAATARAVAAV